MMSGGAPPVSAGGGNVDTERMKFRGSYVYSTGDMFCGVLDVTGRPNGRGILYYYESGECDVATFDCKLIQQGEGIRYTKERDAAYQLIDGQLAGGALDLAEALDVMELMDTPAMRTKDTIPPPTGYDPARSKQTIAWYKYRDMTGLPMNESHWGANPYIPVWAAAEGEAEVDENDDGVE